MTSSKSFAFARNLQRGNFRDCFIIKLSMFVLTQSTSSPLENTKRRRRDLNPRAAINDLLPFQGSPFSLLGTSPNKLTYKRYLISIPVDTAEKVGFEPTAPCGVTGFQDQLLKPLGHLSIALFLSWKVSRDNRYIIISKAKCQQLILLFFKKITTITNYPKKPLQSPDLPVL